MINTQCPVTQHTLNWIHQFIIEYRICPFAKVPVLNNQLRISVYNSTKTAIALEELMTEVYHLDQHPETETTLLVFADSFKDFFVYLDLVDLAERLLYEQGYEGKYQIASFHPEYCFADADYDAVTNYTNRSPYPMLHLLREDRLEQAISAYGDTESIPERNQQLMQQLGLEQIKAILQRSMS